MKHTGWTMNARSKVEVFRLYLLNAGDRHVPSAELQNKIGLNHLEVKAIRHWLQCQGEPVCCTPSESYWIGRTVEEVTRTKENYRARVDSLQEAIKGLELAENNVRMGISIQRSLL